MKKGKVRGVVILILLFIVFSIGLLVAPCMKNVSFAGGFFSSECLSKVLFTFINFPGAVLIYILLGIGAIYKNFVLSLILIFLNAFIYLGTIYFILKFLSRGKLR